MENDDRGSGGDAGAGGVAGLTDELIRRLSLREAATTLQAPLPSMDHRDVSRHARLFCEERHDAGDRELLLVGGADGAGGLVLKWRQKEKLKTTAVALVLCLNIGVDPPDVIKISPCARLECWVDPNSMQPAKALEAIGKNLQAQYERWQPKAKYKMHLDPTMDDVKKLAQSSRRNAKAERVLFHYNGHGVPRPTANGELWVFNQRYTQYIPVSIYDVHMWLGTPAIYVLDCSAAGVLINTFRNIMDPRHMESLRGIPQAFPGLVPPTSPPSDPMREIIVLAGCGPSEVLPQSSELPADVFTACLTTPIKVALRWFASRSLLRHDGITKELIDKIPGRQTDRKTPLGELNWIFTAITDTVAWNVLPRALFQKLFRSDLLVASLFRNYLLAERIMTAVGCTPMSLPRLPPTHQHPMWQAWDMAAEMCLMQLPTLLSDPAAEFQPSPFFSEQLTAFELWLGSGSRERAPPEQLPIVLQVLLSQVHRLRALVLLGRFLDMGSWAVDLALSVGIFPYVLKLLQTTSQDLRATLVFIWAKILALDRSCQVDLTKDMGHTYFIRYLDSTEVVVEPQSRAQATFVLSVICDGHPRGQALCASNGLLPVLLRWLRTYFPPQVSYPAAGHVLLLKWLCLCLGKLCQDSPEISLMAIREGAADLLVTLITVAQPEIRAAAVFGLGCLVHAPPAPGTSPPLTTSASSDALNAALSLPPAPLEDRLPAEQLIANAIRQVVYDPSVLVRCELAVLYARYVRGHAPQVQEALAQQQRKLKDFARQHLHQQQQTASNPPSMDTPEGEGVRAVWMEGAQGSLPRPARGMANPDGGPPPQQQQQGGSSGASSGALNSVGSGGPGGGFSGLVSGPAGGAGAGGGSVRSGVSGIYAGMVESIQLLALDPSPRVAKLGHQVLKLAQCELSFVPGLPGAPLSAMGGTAVAKARLRHGPGWVTSRAALMQNPSGGAGPASGGVSGPASAPGSGVAGGGGSAAAGGSTGPGGVGGLAAQQVAPGLPRVGAPQGQSTQGTLLVFVSSSSVQPPTSSPGPCDTATTASQQQQQHAHQALGGSLELSMPGTPSHSSSPGSPVRDFKFSRPVYVLWTKNDPEPWRAAGGLGGPQASLALMQQQHLSGAVTGLQQQQQQGHPSGAVSATLPSSPAASAMLALPPGMQQVLAGAQQAPAMQGLLGGPAGAAAASSNLGRLSGMPGMAAGVAAAGVLLGVDGQGYAGGVVGPAGALAGLPSYAQSTLQQQQVQMQQQAAAVAAAAAAAAQQQVAAAAQPQALAEPLPVSRVYRLSCEAFARPLLEPGASSWRDVHSAGPGSAPHWTAPPDLKRRQERINAIHTSASRCRALTQPKLREQVYAVETQGEGVAKLCFHPYHNLLVCADTLGFVRVMAYDTATPTRPIHAFHVTNGAPPGDQRVLPTTITHLRHITEADGPLLLTGAADGAVRVWRSHAVMSPPGPAPTMATAMQAVTINLPPGTGREACYGWWGARCHLLAAGGSHPDMVYCWDMNHEMCALMIPMSHVPVAPSSPSPLVDSLHLGVADPNLLLATCSDLTLRLFDVRAPRGPALVLAPFKGPLAGVALEPAGRPGIIVAASERGELVLLDTRGALGATTAALTLGTPPPGLAELTAGATSKVVAAHSRGGVSCLAAHGYAPLLATGTTSQVVKVWTDQCDVVGAIRAHSHPLVPPHKAAGGGGGTITCMAWHSYQPLLAAGGLDSIATVYAIDQAPGGSKVAGMERVSQMQVAGSGGTGGASGGALAGQVQTALSAASVGGLAMMGSSVFAA